jgi:hypothetical protein
LHTPETQLAGDMQYGPAVSLHACPSAANFKQVPLGPGLQAPEASQ